METSREPEQRAVPMSDMRRRDVIALLGGSAAAWPLAARAQQADRVRRIGALMTQAADDPEGQSRLLALAQGLQESGWTIGQRTGTSRSNSAGRTVTIAGLWKWRLIWCSVR